MRTERGIMQPTKEFIFGDDRPFNSCHASTVIAIGDEQFLAAWFGGSREGHGDVAIWLSRRTGEGWSSPKRVADEVNLPHWNPVLSRSPAGRLQLFYKVGENCEEWLTRVMTSGDDVDEWSSYRELPSVEGFPMGPVRSKAIVTSDGTWVAPTSRETSTAWDAAICFSRDDGGSWQLGGRVPLDHGRHRGLGTIQPTLWESSPGHLHMLLRSTAGRIERSDSTDGGSHWCNAYPTALPNNNSGIDIAADGEGTLALCYNPVEGNWGKRTPLVIASSHDNGTAWNRIAVVEDEDRDPSGEERVQLERAHRPNEFSYPALISHGEGLALTYTWKRERIAFCRYPAFNPRSLRS